MHLIPTVIEKTNQREYAYDIYSRLLEDRIILLTGTIDDKMASSIVGQLLYLESIDNSADIYMYINSYCCSMYSGMSIYDFINFIKCDVSTIVIGMAASMAAFLLSAGTKGKRCSLPNSEIMIHQPSGGAQGQATDISIHANHILHVKKKLNTILSERTGQPLEVIERDTERDNFMTAQQALEYGLIDKVIDKK